jgi:hypothetical protein
VKWIVVAEEWDAWRTVVNTVMNLCDARNARNALPSRGTAFEGLCCMQLHGFFTIVRF